MTDRPGRRLVATTLWVCSLIVLFVALKAYRMTMAPDSDVLLAAMALVLVVSTTTGAVGLWFSDR